MTDLTADELLDEAIAAMHAREREAHELAWRNRRIIAKRTHWPDGVIQMCEHLDATRPGWTVWWHPENTYPGFGHPAAYRASRWTGHVTVCGEDPAALVAAMERAPDERHWHYRALCCRR